MITHVKIKGYKSLADVSVDLHPLSVIIGPNAVGKSNLFDALRLLSAMATKSELKDAFESHRGIPVEAFYAEHGIPALLEEGRARFSMSVDVLLSERAIDAAEQIISDLRKGLPTSRTIQIKERRLRYSVMIEFLSSGILRVVDERLEALRQNGVPSQSRLPFFERSGDRISLRMEGQGRPTMVEVGMPYTIISQPLYAPHYPHITAFREELKRWRFYYFEPAVMRENNPLMEVSGIGQNGRDLAAYLYQVKARNPRQFEMLSLSLREIIPAVSGIGVRRTDQGFVEIFIKENGAEYSSRVVSEGTLRVLGIVAILSSDDDATIGFEEPENGTHPRRISLIAKLFEGAARGSERQLLITTHSPILPGYFDETNVVVASREGRQSQFHRFQPEAGPMSTERDIEMALEERIVRGDFGG